MQRAAFLSFNILAIFFFSVSAFAVVTNVSVSGVSRYTESTSSSNGTSTTTKTIYGGYTGAYGGCASPSSSSTCDSCTTMGLLTTTTQFACSLTSVHPNLDLVVSLQVDSVAAGSAYLVKMNAGTAQTITAGVSASPATPTANTTLTVRIPWSSLCAGGDATGCTGGGSQDSFSGTLEVGLSTDNNNFTSGMSQQFQIRFHYRDGQTGNAVITGCGTSAAFCQFRPLAGDEKVYINELARGATGPANQSAVKWQSVRVFTAPSDGGVFAIPLNTAAASYADLEVTDKENVNTSIANNKVTGLVNEQPYMFTIGSVDEATIVQDILSSTTLASNSAFYTATPGKVVGLLDDKCFIATAAYGSLMEPHVQVLRKFRNEFLLTNFVGKKFVETYYRYSPPLAQFISEHEILKAAVRILLWPIVFTAEASLSLHEGWKEL